MPVAPFLAAILLAAAQGAIGERIPIPMDPPIPPAPTRIDLLEKCLTPATADEIVVCGGMEERYRLRGAGRAYAEPEIESVSRERHRLMEGGEAGPGSCSNVGSGGMTGCLVRDIRRAQQQRAGR